MGSFQAKNKNAHNDQARLVLTSFSKREGTQNSPLIGLIARHLKKRRQSRTGLRLIANAGSMAGLPLLPDLLLPMDVEW